MGPIDPSKFMTILISATVQADYSMHNCREQEVIKAVKLVSIVTEDKLINYKIDGVFCKVNSFR